MLGLFIVVTYVEQRLIVLPNTAGKKELYGSNPCYCNINFKVIKLKYINQYCIVYDFLNYCLKLVNKRKVELLK